VGGKFTRDDLKILLTLVEPCAIAIENAMLFHGPNSSPSRTT